MSISRVPLDAIVAAATRIRGHVRHTPVHHSARLSAQLGATVMMKMENMQHTGAYKERGALNKLLSLSEDAKKGGVFAASAGNHAQGLAFHAGRMGVGATIFMPMGTPVIKVTRTKSYGAEVILTGASFDDAFHACVDHVTQNNGTMVHPFDDLEVIAGQGTIGLELIEQVPDLDVLVVPIGGGGLISGIASAMKAFHPSLRIVGVEPEKIPSMRRAVGGDDSVQPAVVTIADGINVRKTGIITTDICRELVDEYVSVTDDEICRALLFLLEGEKTVAEGAGAAAVAALQSGKVTDIVGKKVGVIISGGNIDVNVISHVIESGLVDSGRRFRVAIDIPDRPGSLSQLINHISLLEANVVNVNNERTRMTSFGSARVNLTLDVRDDAHAREIVDSLYKTFPENKTLHLESHQI